MTGRSDRPVVANGKLPCKVSVTTGNRERLSRIFCSRFEFSLFYFYSPLQRWLFTLALEFQLCASARVAKYLCLWIRSCTNVELCEFHCVVTFRPFLIDAVGFIFSLASYYARDSSNTDGLCLRGHSLIQN